jgi:short-subunit dehydrogenase
MGDWLRHVFRGRPGWMNALMVFCFYMAVVYVPWDFFVKPVEEDAEVWFGVLLRGWLAKLTEPLHWAIYAAGAYGFLRMRSWMHPWAAVYAAQVAIGVLVWPLLYVIPERGVLTALPLAVVSFAAFAWLTIALWRAKPLFRGSPASLRERYGDWALVTGASAGIGEAFARALAARGISCVLTARRGDRLEALARELESAHGVKTRVVAEDLAKPDGAARVAAAVSDLPIGILVNNAGLGGAGRFDKLALERVEQQILLNCLAPAALTHRLLPGMLERRRGAVIITGSVAGMQPLPLHGIYAATKAFDRFFGEALFVELRDQGIDVIVLEPGPTESEFQAVANEISHWGEPAEDVVALALRSLGRQPAVVSGWWNWLRGNLAARLGPRALTGYVARRVMAAQTPEELR